MNRRIHQAGLCGLLALASLAWPAAGRADHVSITASASARLIERVGANSWLVEVAWSATCPGSGTSGASYQGDLTLVDIDTGERIYLGGVSSATGSAKQLVSSAPKVRRMRPELKLSCFDNSTLHGSDTVIVGGAQVLIPPIYEDGGGGGGSGGGSGGGGSGSGDPTEPLQSGGCVHVLQGTPAADTLNGTAAAEVIFGFEGDDTIRGGDGHDCLLGEAGNDKLFGENGFDRLTGGPGNDQLTGGPGVNAYDAGPGKDYVNARNGKRELVRCGSGRDRARIDRRDRVRSCEKVSRPAR